MRTDKAAYGPRCKLYRNLQAREQGCVPTLNSAKAKFLPRQLEKDGVVSIMRYAGKSYTHVRGPFTKVTRFL
jgi:hypothetical protein